MEVRLEICEDEDPHVFYVSVEGRGVPDFRIKADTEEDARDYLLSEVYNALDGLEDICDAGEPEV